MDVNLTGSFLCGQLAFTDDEDPGPCRSADHQQRVGDSAGAGRLNSDPFTAMQATTIHQQLTKSLSIDGRSLGINCGQIDIGNALMPLTTRMNPYWVPQA